MTDIDTLARLTGAMRSEVRHELDRAIRRSEPDAREVYGLIRALGFVAGKRAGEWGKPRGSEGLLRGARMEWSG